VTHDSTSNIRLLLAMQGDPDMKEPLGSPFGIGSQLLADNVPAHDVITYIGWNMCAVSPREGVGPIIVKLDDLVAPRTYRRDDILLKEGGAAPEQHALVPGTFCWTRFGTESGMTVEQILRRKEMERQSSGVFVWGIGNALGDAIRTLQEREAEPLALFSPIAGRAALRDSAPDAVVAWRTYRDATGGATPLPPGVLVISRASSATGGPKRYYGLFCSSAAPLALTPHAEVEIGLLRNVKGTNWVGDQQTTAVVSVDASGVPRRRYAVSLAARLVEPYYAEMLEPVRLTDAQVARTHDVAAAGDVERWKATVREIVRNEAPPA
jgi:hypothetical protein